MALSAQAVPHKVVGQKAQPVQHNQNAWFTGVNGQQVEKATKAKSLEEITGKSLKKGPRKAGITAQPAGAEMKMTRGGSYLYYSSGWYIGGQSGFTKFVLGDGNKVYIRDLVTGLNSGYWVEGTISEDKSRIAIATEQALDEIDGIGDIKLCAINFFTDEKLEVDSITFTLNDAGEYALDTYTSYSAGCLAGYLIYEDKLYVQSNYDYGTTFSRYIAPDPVTPPAGIVAKEYPINGSRLEASGFVEFSGTVNVAWDGTDCYIQGMFSELPDAWIMGTRNVDTLTFAPQYVGEDDFSPYYACGFLNSQIADAHAEVSDADETIEFTGTIGLLGKDSGSFSGYTAVINGALIGTPPTPVEVPDELETVTMPILAEYYDGDYADLNSTVEVGWDGDDVYIKGILHDVPDGWVKGTLANDTVTFPIQYVGKDQSYGSNMYFIASDEWNDNDDITEPKFYYDAVNNVFISDQYLFQSSKNNRLAWYCVYFGEQIGAADETVLGILSDDGSYYGTFYDPYLNRIVDDNTEIFVATFGDENKNYLDTIPVDGNVIPAETPVILKSFAQQIVLKWVDTNNLPTIAANDLEINDEEIDADSVAIAPVFVLGLNESKVAFVLNDSEPVDAGTVLIPASAAAAGISFLPFEKPQTITPGDMDGNGLLEVNDVVILADLAMSGGATAEQLAIGDLDGSGSIDVNDVVILAGRVMGN